jgi:hypothetical protein
MGREIQRMVEDLLHPGEGVRLPSGQKFPRAIWGAECKITGVLGPSCRRSAPSVQALEGGPRGTCGVYQFRRPGKGPCEAEVFILLYYGFSHSRKGSVCP